MRPVHVLIVALVLAASAFAQRGREARLPEGVEVERDIEYGKGGGHALLLDLYRPKEASEGKLPCVIFIHGGGWRGGDKMRAPVVQIVPRGYVGISINYRLSGEATFPAAVEDCKCAVRWVRENAEEYGIDPDRLGVWGSSAGGHLALMVGLADDKAGLEGKGGHEGVSSRVQAVCSWFGPADLTVGHDQFQGGSGQAPLAFLGGTLDEKKEAYEQASPVTHATKDDPPVLMIHGDKDNVVPLDQSERMLAAIEKAGAEAKLVIVKGAGHGFKAAGNGAIEPSKEEIDAVTFDFFDEHLK